MNRHKTITTVFRSVIEFTVDDTSDDVSVIEQICSRALDFGRKLDNCIANSGGPCWNAYITAEHTNLTKLVEYEAKLRRYINKRKGAKEL